ncbi:MAG: helix-turn-helix domain-containing protein [Ruminococcaceae bacterium]|nr:helix-turn-helix domain-containing protein [Oscillospiraceae bacterium]
MHSPVMIHKNFFYISYMHYDASEALHVVTGSPSHIHNVGELLFCTEGSSLITCGTSVMRVNAPYVFYCPAGMPHQQDNSASKRYTRWCFPLLPSDLEGTSGLPDQFFAVQLDDAQCRQLSLYVEAMYTYWGCREFKLPDVQPYTSPSDRLRLKYLLLLFLNELKPLIPDDISTQSTYISDVCLFISDHIEQRLSLDLLAERFFVGRTTLTGDFRRVMDMSVVEFITATRLNRAKLLLQEGKTLAEIAEQCGFASVSYFIKVFRRGTGLSPAQYRAALDKLPANL